MSTPLSCRNTYRLRMGPAILALLFACFTIANAQENKDEPRKKGDESSQKAAPRRPSERKGQQQAQPAQSTPPPASQPQAQPGQGQGRQGRQNADPGERRFGNRPQQQAQPAQSTPPPASEPQAQPGQGQGRQGRQTADPGERRFGNRPQQQNQNQNQQAPGQGGRQFGNQPQRGGIGSTGGSRPPDRPADSRPGGGPQNHVVRYSNGQPHTVRMSDGGMVRRSEAGHVMEVRTPSGAVIRHAPSGVRRVEVVRPGDRVVVTTGRSYGYVQRPVVFASRSYVQRTYVVRGVAHANVYRPLAWHGISLHVYTPVRYFRPAYYSWAYNPWARPVAYSWGWARDPWYRYYGGYFVPDSTYASPTLWLTDYLIASTLQAAYEARLAASDPPPAAYPAVTQSMLTPEVKRLIADEVRRQIDVERAESQNINAAAYNADAAPPMFADNSRHTFVVSDPVMVYSGAGECALSEGDVIQTMGIPPLNSPTADAIVLASKPQDCRRGIPVSIQIQDLQEMQNHLRSTIGRGLGDLQSRGGQAGLPALPANVTGTLDTLMASQVQAETGAAGELMQVAQDADRAEQSVIDQSATVAVGSGGGAPVTISLGQSIDEVTATQGQPQKIVDLGNKKIFVYSDIKITFIDGRVADVQ